MGNKKGPNASSFKPELSIHMWCLASSEDQIWNLHLKIYREQSIDTDRYRRSDNNTFSGNRKNDAIGCADRHPIVLSCAHRFYGTGIEDTVNTATV